MGASTHHLRAGSRIESYRTALETERPSGWGSIEPAAADSIDVSLKCSRPTRCTTRARRAMRGYLPARGVVLARRTCFPLARFVHAQWTAAHLKAVHVLNGGRSEEHTSELQSRENLVCRL